MTAPVASYATVERLRFLRDLVGSQPWLLGSACAGALIAPGAAAVAPTRIGVIEFFFLLAPLVAVPLGLVPVLRREASPLLRLAAGLQPLAALAPIASFAFDPGPTAAALAGVWAMVPALLGLAGIGRVFAGRFGSIDELCTTAALCYIPVGAGWLVLSRAGLEPLGFREPIVLLTAVHFHYTAFVAPLIAAEIGRALGDGPERRTHGRLHAAAAVGLVAGTPLLAIGFTVSPVLKLIAATTLVGSVGGFALLELEPALAGKVGRPTARAALVASAVSALVGLAAAFTYEVGQFTGRDFLSIPDMAVWHGTTMGVGFALCGLAGWNLAARAGVSP